MSETPGRKLFRSPFPFNSPPQTPDVSPNEVTSPPDRDNLIADIETHKHPSFPSYPSHNTRFIAKVRFIADVVTHKHPSFPPHPSYSKSSIADAGVYKHPSFPPYYPSYTRSPISARKKNQGTWKSKHTGVLLVVLIIFLLPTFIGVIEIINAVTLYKQMQDGIAHVQAAANVFHGGIGNNIANYLATKNLYQALGEINAAHADFASLSDKLDQDAAINLFSNLLPAQIRTARALGHIATDGTAAAQQLIKTAIDIAPAVAPAFQKSPSGTDTMPLKAYITPASFQTIEQTLTAIAPLVHDMRKYAQELSLNTLPISPKQSQLLASVLPLLPVLDAGLSQEHEWIGAIGWFLGIDSQRTFLIEPMDSSELRATGGFTGQFGELILNGAHVGPLKLANIGKYEEDHTAEGSPPDPTVYPKVIGQSPPALYSQWWPVVNFGLRDANLSADFPTSAKIAMNRYAYEFGNNVDGVITFTPTLIEHVLHVTGPITIPAYQETLTEYNLVDRLHYYQLDNRGIRREEIIEHINDPQVARKLFTQRVTTTLISVATHLPLNKMLSMANEMLYSMKTKDLQAYITNPQLESLIAKYGSTASLDRSTDHDGLFIVQSNLSASKASQYVTTSIQDTITLNARGGATHSLQVTLDYQQKGDVYGFDTYRDYVRVYVPVQSQLLAGNGFDQYDKPYCGDALSRYRLCSPDVYGDGSLVCSPPIEIGYATSYLNDPYRGTDHPLDVIGPPQNQQSDEVGRAMFGGWVVIPKNCTMKVTLSWYVPPMNEHLYGLLLQAQAGVNVPLDLTIHPASNTCVPSQGNTLHFSDVMDGEDMSFTVKQQGSECSLVSK